MGFHGFHGGTPSSHPFFGWDLPFEIIQLLGTPHDYGTPQVVLEAHAASAKTGSIDGAAMAQRG